MLAVALAVLLVVFTVGWTCNRWRDVVSGRLVSGRPLCVRAPLLLIAHPDDECMFFSPTVLNLQPEQRPLSVLCCSTGNYYNQGEIRKKELVQSCAALGIPAANVTVLDHRDLPDDPRVQWNQHLLSELILSHIQEKNIDMVITFDERGVSGHSNHISLFAAVSSLHSSRRLPEGCEVLVLESVSIFRKYLSVLDLPFSWLAHQDVLFVSSGTQYRQAKEAMMRHESQLLWFRHIYLLFSRYMTINSLRFLNNIKAEKKS